MTEKYEYPSLLIEKALTEGERLTFLDRFTGKNPHWKGAHVADVIATLDDTDSNCGDIEKVVGYFQPTKEECALYRLAFYAVLYSDYHSLIEHQDQPLLLAEHNLRRIRDLVAKAKGQP